MSSFYLCSNERLYYWLPVGNTVIAITIYHIIGWELYRAQNLSFALVICYILETPLHIVHYWDIFLQDVANKQDTRLSGNSRHSIDVFSPYIIDVFHYMALLTNRVQCKVLVIEVSSHFIYNVTFLSMCPSSNLMCQALDDAATFC